MVCSWGAGWEHSYGWFFFESLRSKKKESEAVLRVDYLEKALLN